MSIGRVPGATGIQPSIVDAKGDLIVATAADSVNRLAVGSNDQVLTADSTTATGLKWATPVSGDITSVTAGTGISGGGTTGDVTITNTMATAIDAKGDLVAGTGADTFSRLAVGANNTVLTADSSTATGLKWATPSAPSFVGCAAFASANQIISNSTVTTLTFNSEKFDTNAFHDNVTNTGRFTIPANYGGYYVCTLLFAFEANSTGFRRTEIWKNGSKIYQTDGNGNNNGSTDTKPITAIVNLVATDYIEFRVVQNSGGNLTAYTTDQYCQASIQYLGA